MGFFSPRVGSRDGRATGRIAGLVLADTFARIIDAAHPQNVVGASRDADDNAAVVVFPDGGLLEAKRWLQTPGLQDAVLLHVNTAHHEVRVFVPNAAADAFDITVIFTFRTERGRLSTSLPAFAAIDDDALLDAFQDGLAEGLEEHARTGEILPGFGALGDYNGPG